MRLGGRLVGKIGGRRPSAAPDPETIRGLADLLAETGLTEIEYAVGDTRIRVARKANGAAPAEHAAPASAPAADKVAANGAHGAAHRSEAHPGTVTSPIVGVAYLAPQPGMPPFVRPGDQVGEGQTLLIIEAMKVMNQIRAPRAGRIARVLVQDAEPVEYGAPLMLIE